MTSALVSPSPSHSQFSEFTSLLSLPLSPKTVPFAIQHLGNHQQDRMLLKSLLVFSFLVLVLNANDKLKKAEERNSLVRDISAAMEKAWGSFEKFNENIQRIADDQAKIDRTIQSLVEEIKAMRQQQLLQFAVAGGF